MKSKAIFIISLITVILFSLNFVVAAEISDNSSDMSNLDEYKLNSAISNDNLEIEEYSGFLNSNINSEDNPLGVDDVSNTSKVIYVGHHNTTLYGNGSYENPFSNFKSACDSVNGENNVTLNIFGGTYYMGENLEHQEFLKFNTSNLNIIGINGTVIITYLHNEKIQYTSVQTTYAEAFELASDNANITISNIIFNATGCVRTALLLEGNYDYFFPFYGKTNLAVFNNCSFIGFEIPRITGAGYNSKFVKCYFNIFSVNLFYDSFIKNTYHIFEYCIFDKDVRYLNKIYLPCEITIDNCWFGQNNLPQFITPPKGMVMQNGRQVSGYVIPVSRYAVLSVSYTYLGDNKFEIVGQFTWNGTNDTDGMENFQPMDVIFETTTGSVNKTVTLVNGSFRTIYTSNSNENELFVTLINEEFKFNFTTTDVVIDAPSIHYGDDQNITVNFSQSINSTVNITINNETYSIKVNESDSFTYTIEDILTEGNYTVNVLIIDEENQLYGSNSTSLSVSKVNNYVFDVVPSSEVKVGENATISITLPEDVEGNVTIKFGNDTKILPANQTMVVNFNNLNATTYPVTVTYTGSDKYTGKEKVDSVSVDKAESSVNLDNRVFTYGDVIAIPFTITNASGVNVRVLNKDGVEVANTTSEGTEFTLDTLPAGEYTLEVTTIVNDNHEEFTADDITLTIKKAESDLTLNDSYEFAYGENAVINVVTENSTADVIVSLDGFTANVSGNEITLPTLNVGKYTLNVTTNPDENHNNATKTATITINKVAPSMNVIVEPVENITTKVDVTLTISLPSDATGEVTVKINGKKTDNKSANETITIDLNNQAGDYVVDVTYSGDKNYESDMATQEYTVSKTDASISAKQIDFEEGNASKIEVTVPDVESGIVLVDVAGKKFYGDIDSGKATITLEGVPEGNYIANIKFFGDDKYKEATTTIDIKVSEDKIITELKEQLEEANAKVDNLTGELANATGKIADLTVELNETQSNASKLSEDLADAQANVTKLSDDLADANAKVDNLTSELEKAQSNVTIVVDGVEYPVDVINGTATIKTNATKPITKKDTVIVVDKTFTRIATDYYADERGEMFYAILKDSEGNVLANKTVQIAVNGPIYNVTTDDQGRAGLRINVAIANTYTYALSFQGDDEYNAAPIASSKLTITKKSTSITAANKVFKAKAKNKKISVTLKTVKNPYDKKTYLKSGKKVTLKVNGKTYTAKINKKGVAKFTIKITKKGKYTAKIKFAGDKTYKTSSKTIKITIK
ncbi:hypothetical protein [Methanobrevibacter sp.]